MITPLAGMRVWLACGRTDMRKGIDGLAMLVQQVVLTRKSALFADSDSGGERAAAMCSLIVTAKLNGVDPRAWLADVLARIADHPVRRLHELLPWNWRDQKIQNAIAA